MRPYAEALESRGHDWKLPCGAHVFLSPDQYPQAIESLQGKQLKASHLIVAESLEYLVQEAMDEYAKTGCYAKQREYINEEEEESDLALMCCSDDAKESVSMSSHEADIGPGDEEDARFFVFAVKRTFLHIVQGCEAAESIVQSSTDADSRNGQNPRRTVLNCFNE